MPEIRIDLHHLNNDILDIIKDIMSKYKEDRPDFAINYNMANVAFIVYADDKCIGYSIGTERVNYLNDKVLYANYIILPEYEDNSIIALSLIMSVEDYCINNNICYNVAYISESSNTFDGFLKGYNYTPLYRDPFEYAKEIPKLLNRINHPMDKNSYISIEQYRGNPKEIILADLYVSEENRNNGYGTYLVESAIKWIEANADDAEGISWHIERDNEEVLSLARKYGFSIDTVDKE